MPSEQASILIPDISGYTEFISRTELDHSSMILKHLLETIVEAAGEDFVVSEIEGDAVLLYRKGPPPTKKEITDKCINIFQEFHKQSSTMEGMRVCQCIACKGVVKLSLKFVVHYGTISENRIANFIKASGIDMVIAHRLLKNKIDRDEYVLITKNFLDNTPDSEENLKLEWFPLKETYSSIGEVEFDFATLDRYKDELDKAKKDCADKLGEKVFEQKLKIQSSASDVFALLIDLTQRKNYLHGALDIEYMITTAAIGMPQTWKLEQDTMEAIPIGLDIVQSKILYFEEIRNIETDERVIVEFVVDELDKHTSELGINLYTMPGEKLSKEGERRFTQLFTETLKLIKTCAEKGYTA